MNARDLDSFINKFELGLKNLIQLYLKERYEEFDELFF
jgi:hypothetical protein